VWDDPLAKAWVVLEVIVKRERKETKWPEKWMGFSTIGQEALDKVVSEKRDPRQQPQPIIRSSANADLI
jgi:hypothetical protein